MTKTYSIIGKGKAETKIRFEVLCCKSGSRRMHRLFQGDVVKSDKSIYRNKKLHLVINLSKFSPYD